MALVFSVADGGFVQSSVSRLEFLVKGPLENPNLEPISSPTYVSSGMMVNSAVLNISNGAVGSFKVEVRSTDTDGTNEVTHISDTITISAPGVQAWGLDIDTASIGSMKVVRLYIQYLSGGVSSDISLTLE